jgi:hypothetical protein
METEVCGRLMDDSSVELLKLESMMHDQCLSDINNLGHELRNANLKDRRSWKRVNVDDIPIRGFHSEVIQEESWEPDVTNKKLDATEIAFENSEDPKASPNELPVVGSHLQVAEDPDRPSLKNLPCDLVLRMMAMLSPKERFILCGVSRLLNALFCEPALWRHINLTSCSASITDAAVETMLAITDHLEALVIRPLAPPPFLSWRFLQALAAHPCTRSLRVLVIHNCEGLLCNTPG